MSKNPSDWWMETLNNHEVEFPFPRADQLDPEEMAHALGMMPRFNGHIYHHYSVAEHCLWVSRLVEQYAGEEIDRGTESYSSESIRQLALAGLLHDASEAYLADIVAPAKWYWAANSDTGYSRLEAGIMAVVMAKHGLGPEDWLHPLVKRADYTMLHTEKLQLKPMGVRPWVNMPPPLTPAPDLGLEREAAKRAWLRRYAVLTRAA